MQIFPYKLEPHLKIQKWFPDSSQKNTHLKKRTLATHRCPIFRNEWKSLDRWFSITIDNIKYLVRKSPMQIRKSVWNSLVYQYFGPPISEKPISKIPENHISQFILIYIPDLIRLNTKISKGLFLCTVIKNFHQSR